MCFQWAGPEPVQTWGVPDSVSFKQCLPLLHDLVHNLLLQGPYVCGRPPNDARSLIRTCPVKPKKGGSMSWLFLSSGFSTEKIIGDIKMPFGLAESFVRMPWASFHLTRVHTSQLPGEYNQLLLSSQCRLPLNLVREHFLGTSTCAFPQEPFSLIAPVLHHA